jgi:hypothetical protein
MHFATLLGEFAAGLNNLVNTWNGLGLAPVTVTSAQIEAYQLNVLANGPPASQVAILTQLGLTPAEIQGLANFTGASTTTPDFTFPTDLTSVAVSPANWPLS